MRLSPGTAPYATLSNLGRTKFTTSGAHDVIAITSPQNGLSTEELRDRAKSQDEVSLPLRKARFGCFFRQRKGTLELTLA